MERPMKKRLEIPKITPKKAGILGVGVVLIVLVVLLCITVNMRAHIQGAYSDARNEIGEVLYTELYMLCQTFDQVDVPGAEIQDIIIPGMNDCYLAALALNEAMTNGFGERYRVLSPDDVAALDNAFASYDTAFRSGKPTDDAEEAMRACISSVRAILAARYPNGVLKAA